MTRGYWSKEVPKKTLPLPGLERWFGYRRYHEIVHPHIKLMFCQVQKNCHKNASCLHFDII